MKFRDIKTFTNVGSYEISMPLDFIGNKIIEWQNEEPKLNLLPDFQRGHVWTKKQQISYMEFFLSGGITGRTLYFNCPEWPNFGSIKKGEYNEFVIVDGLQRLTAILKFVRAEIPAFGHYVNNVSTTCKGPFFEDRLRMSYYCDSLRVNINNLKTEKEVLEWYLELNAEGTPHTKEELERVRLLIKKGKR